MPTLYKFEDIWTEELLLNLPQNEDNRYEYKAGKLIDDFKSGDKKQDDLEATLSKEIAALANSFGGTLFLGVRDQKKEFDGCDKIIKGNESTLAWLERKIPEWFEFRLYSFRVNYVVLSDETKKKLGPNREIIHVDVWDSGLLPHQVKKSGIYYYRENSTSRPAPHYYLSFLWTSRTNTMSEKVSRWCLEFLNPCIEELTKFQTFLSHRLYKAELRSVYGADILTYDFELSPARYLLNSVSRSNLVAKQFFYTFPRIQEKFNDLLAFALDFERDFNSLREKVALSEVLEIAATDAYDRRNHPNSLNPPGMNRMLIEFAGDFGSPLAQLPEGIASEQIVGIGTRLITLKLLEIESTPHAGGDQMWNKCSELAKKLDDDIEITAQVSTVAKKMKELGEKIKSLAESLDRERDELSSTFNATYF